MLIKHGDVFAQIFSCCPKNLSCPKFGGAAAPLAPPARNCLGMGNHQKGIDKNLNHVSGEQNGPNYASRKTIRDQDPLARWLLF